LHVYALCLKNGTDVAHYNFNAYQWIWILVMILADMLLGEYSSEW